MRFVVNRAPVYSTAVNCIKY